MSTVFIDANIPMYAAGAAHPLREHSQQLIRALAAGQLDGVTDAEVFQEILYRYFHIGERVKGFRVFDGFYRVMLGRILPVEDADVYEARSVAERYPTLNPRDAIHAALMARHGIQDIVTADTHFEAVEGIRRIDPRAFREES